MTETSGTRCLLCDGEIPPGADKCPKCGTPVKGDRTAARHTVVASSPVAAGWNLSESIPKVSLPKISNSCPLCSYPIDESHQKCPRCGVPLRSDAATHEEIKPVRPIEIKSPEPVAAPPLESKAPIEIEPPPNVPPVAPVPSRAMANRTGATNGTSMTRNQGIVNGTGIINGTGRTNGIGVSTGRVGRSNRRQLVLRWKFLVVLAIVAVVLATSLFLAYGQPAGLAIDGKFGDWSDVDMFGMYVPAIGSCIAVEEWSIQNDGNSLYVYMRTADDLMSTLDVDSFYVFVDSDHNSRTGYSVSSLGADYMLVLDGWEREVRSASVMQYDQQTDQLDWNYWTSYGSMTYSVDSERLEARADLPIVLGNNARYLLLSQTSSPDRDFSVSHPVPRTGGLLVARLEPGTSIDSDFGTVPSQANTAFAKLVLSCEGRGGSVTGMTPTVFGASVASPFSGTSLVPGEEKTFDIDLNTLSAPANSVVSVVLTESGFVSTFSEVTVTQSSVLAYVSSAPASIEIDGAFGDWLARPGIDYDSTLVTNPNINMTATAFDGATDFASFYVSVEGEVFHGAYAPFAKAPWYGGGGGEGPVTHIRRSGEDILRIFIDSDINNDTGILTTREGKTVGADYLIDIRGLDGEIVSKTLMQSNGLGWTALADVIFAAKDLQQLELRVPTASIGGNVSVATIIETTDWKSGSDWAWAASVPDPWVVNGPGDTYQSDTGALWEYVGTPSLEPGDRIVDIALTTDDGIVVLVTNTGRTYYWDFASSTDWTAGEIYPIDVGIYSEAVSMSFFSKTGAWLLTANGSYFYLMDAISPPANKEWTFQDTVATGVSDFIDLNYEGGTMYALRSGPNTQLSYSNNGNSFTLLTSPTGSTTNQTEFTYIPGGPGSADDRVFVMCENGDIRYSANGGLTWSSLGNLPTPTGGNTSKYVGMGIDSTGYMWIVTDTGYCYCSTDTTTYASFNYTGRAPITSIVAIIPLPAVAVVPEFHTILVPMAGIVLVVLSRRFVSRGKATR